MAGVEDLANAVSTLSVNTSAAVAPPAATAAPAPAPAPATAAPPLPPPPPPLPPLQTGTVEHVRNGYAFIRPGGGGRDVFAHSSQFQQDFAIIRSGQPVTFGMGRNSQGPCAVGINLDPIPAGYDRWNSGETGYAYDTLFAFVSDDPLDLRNRQPRAYRRAVVLAIIALHDLHKTRIEPHAAQANKVNNPQIAADKEAAGKLFYSEEGSTTALWRAEARNTSNVRLAIGEVRLYVERLLSLLRESNAADMYLRVDPLRGDDRDDRWRKLTSLVHSLWRGSDSGPDAPLHWAQHVGDNTYRFTFVTKRSIMEVVEKLGSILEVLLEGRRVLRLPGRKPPKEVASVRAVTFALRAALDAPSIVGRARRKNQAHTNPSDVFEALLAAWKTIPIQSDDLKENVLSNLLNSGAGLLRTPYILPQS